MVAAAVGSSGSGGGSQAGQIWSWEPPACCCRSWAAAAVAQAAAAVALLVAVAPSAGRHSGTRLWQHRPSGSWKPQQAVDRYHEAACVGPPPLLRLLLLTRHSVTQLFPCSCGQPAPGASREVREADRHSDQGKPRNSLAAQPHAAAHAPLTECAASHGQALRAAARPSAAAALAVH